MADVLAMPDEYRAQTWSMLIQKCNNSGLTKREFCQQRGISEKSFYCWLRKLRSHMAEAAGLKLVRLDSAVQGCCRPERTKEYYCVHESAVLGVIDHV